MEKGFVMRIVALLGSQRKNGAGARYMGMIESAVTRNPGVEFETVSLSDYGIGMCRGCMICYRLGESACPIRDRLPEVVEKLKAADAVIFYSPTYTVSVSGLIKNFFDRCSYICHRPVFKGKYALLLTSVGGYGDTQCLRTLGEIVPVFGFKIMGALGISSRYDTDAQYAARMKQRLIRKADELVRLAGSGKPIKPTMQELVAFRYQKIIFGQGAKTLAYDEAYWREAGWLEPETVYYYEAGVPGWKRWVAGVATKVLVRVGVLTV